MIKRRHRVAFLGVFIVSIASILGAQETNVPSITDTSRRVIHIESYEPTPGDVYTLSINYGIDFETGTAAQTDEIQLILNGDFTLDVPFIGSINVRTLSYDELRSLVTSRVRERSYANFVSLNLTAPAVFDVLIWGGVRNPGFYTVSSLTRLQEAVLIAGGWLPAGSRRTVELSRSGGSRRYDLVAYSFLGEASQNPFMRPGDQVRVPLIESSAEIRGAVAQPGRVEILPGETIGKLIDLAGGLLPTAQIAKTGLTRLGDDNRYSLASLLDVDLTTIPARSGDIVTIPASTTSTELVQVEGAIYTTPAEEGTPRTIPTSPVVLDVPFTPGMTVLGLLEQFGGPTPFAQTERSFLIRSGSGERSPIPDLGEVWDSRQWDRDIPLSPGDRLVIPMKRLVVSVGGQVNRPGSFSFTNGYDVTDYLELAGGVAEQDGNADRLFFAEPDGTLTRVDADTAVPIGTTIYVGRSTWGQAKRLFGNVFVVTGWATGLIGVFTVVYNFIQIFTP